MGSAEAAVVSTTSGGVVASVVEMVGSVGTVVRDSAAKTGRRNEAIKATMTDNLMNFITIPPFKGIVTGKTEIGKKQLRR